MQDNCFEASSPEIVEPADVLTSSSGRSEDTGANHHSVQEGQGGAPVPRLRLPQNPRRAHVGFFGLINRLLKTVKLV
jgi:hypothetical protein